MGGRGACAGRGNGWLYDNYLLLLTNGSSVRPAAPFPGASRVFGKRICVARGECGRFRGVGFRPGVLRRRSVEVKGVPADIPHDTIDRLIYELLQEFAVPVDVQALRREKIAAVMACSGARSMSRTISTEEAESLLGQLCEGGNVSFTLRARRSWPKSHWKKSAINLVERLPEGI